MASKKVKAYKASWSFADKIGSIKFQYDKEMTWSDWQRFRDKAEFGIVLSILQNESEVHYTQGKSGKWHIHTGIERPGDD